MKKIWNPSTLLMETAKKATCQPCKGGGRVMASRGSWECHLCNGWGWVWKTGTGVTLRPWGKVGRDEKFY